MSEPIRLRDGHLASSALIQHAMVSPSPDPPSRGRDASVCQAATAMTRPLASLDAFSGQTTRVRATAGNGTAPAKVSGMTTLAALRPWFRAASIVACVALVACSGTVTGGDDSETHAV